MKTEDNPPGSGGFYGLENGTYGSGGVFQSLRFHGAL